MSRLRKIVKSEFGEISIFDNFIIAVMNEGITITLENHQILFEIANENFKNKPFAYITNRINSYSVDPNVYLQTSKIENLIAFAVVSQSDLSISNAQFEKQFLTKPHKSFNKLIDAINWCETLIKDL